jgi:hypothetical protein
MTSLPCNYVIDASVTVGSITPGATESFAGSDGISQATNWQLEAVTQTTTGTEGVTFQTDPGVALTLSVTLNAPTPFFFFVQNNQVNGGYKGPLTNPLVFQPSEP